MLMDMAGFICRGWEVPQQCLFNWYFSCSILGLSMEKLSVFRRILTDRFVFEGMDGSCPKVHLN